MLLTHVERMAYTIKAGRGQAWVNVENCYFWWAWQETTSPWPRTREAARRDLIELAKENEAYMRACIDAGVFAFSMVDNRGRVRQMPEPVTLR